MRPIKFRGKAVMEKHELDYHEIPNYQGWIWGSLIVDGDNCYIVGDIAEASEDGLIHEWWAKVRSESVGQRTGNTNIYEGDICRIRDEEPYSNDNITTDYDWEMIGVVVYKYGSFWFEVIQDRGTLIPMCDYLNSEMALMVIGNIQEDKHLLEETP